MSIPQLTRLLPVTSGAAVEIADAGEMGAFAVSKPGPWGFAATGVGPDPGFEDNELRLNAVISKPLVRH